MKYIHEEHCFVKVLRVENGHPIVSKELHDKINTVIIISHIWDEEDLVSSEFKCHAEGPGSPNCTKYIDKEFMLTLLDHYNTTIDYVNNWDYTFGYSQAYFIYNGEHYSMQVKLRGTSDPKLVRIEQ